MNEQEYHQPDEKSSKPLFSEKEDMKVGQPKDIYYIADKYHLGTSV